jgi:hypothetical protein
MFRFKRIIQNSSSPGSSWRPTLRQAQGEEEIFTLMLSLSKHEPVEAWVARIKRAMTIEGT